MRSMRKGGEDPQKRHSILRMDFQSDWGPIKTSPGKIKLFPVGVPVSVEVSGSQFKRLPRFRREVQKRKTLAC